MVATVALGMGLDFEHLECVIHINLPKSIENLCKIDIKYVKYGISKKILGVFVLLLMWLLLLWRVVCLDLMGFWFNILFFFFNFSSKKSLF